MKRNFLLTAVLTALAGCGGDEAEEPSGPNGGEPGTCGAAGYVAFDASNYDNQLRRLDAFGQMVSKTKAAAGAEPFDAAAAATAFAEAKRLYQETASLQEKVQGRTDDHLPARPGVGVDLDARIVQWLDAGAAATTGLEANVAAQWVEKSLIEFFSLSVHHEMVDGTRSHWDEAFGYFGAPVDNDEGGRVALSSVATKRDGGNGTSLAQEAFNGLVDGRCALDDALTAAGAEEVDAAREPAVAAAVAAVDGAMQRTLAYSVGHEAFGAAELQAALSNSPDDAALQAEMWVKLAELDPYFRPLERLMLAAGGEPKARAEAIRAALDAAWAGWPDGETSWMAGFDAAGILERIEAEYGIDVQG